MSTDAEIEMILTSLKRTCPQCASDDTQPHEEDTGDSWGNDRDWLECDSCGNVWEQSPGHAA